MLQIDAPPSKISGYATATSQYVTGHRLKSRLSRCVLCDLAAHEVGRRRRLSTSWLGTARWAGFDAIALSFTSCDRLLLRGARDTVFAKSKRFGIGDVSLARTFVPGNKTTTYPIQSNVNKRAQVFLFARIFYNITFTYKLKHLRFQLTRNKNCKEHLDQASVCLDDF